MRSRAGSCRPSRFGVVFPAGPSHTKNYAMKQFVAWQTAAATRRAGESIVGNVKLMRSDFFGPSKFFYSMSREERMQLHEELLKQPDSPHAFLIEVPGNSETPAHFHRVPQYQVFVQGGGKLGRRHAVETVTIHYTDEFTGYGPIFAGDEGLSYFTLRNFFDPGAEYVDRDGARAKLRPSARRYLVIDRDKIGLSVSESVAARNDVALDCVIEPHDDGLASYVLRAGPGVTATGPDPDAGGGQYWLVLNGSLRHAGIEYARHSLAWVSRSEGPFTVIAGDDGFEVGIFQFPRALTSRAAHTQAA